MNAGLLSKLWTRDSHVPHSTGGDMPFGQVRAHQTGNVVTITIELPPEGEPSNSGWSENLVNPSEWISVPSGNANGDELRIKLTVCKPTGAHDGHEAPPRPQRNTRRCSMERAARFHDRPSEPRSRTRQCVACVIRAARFRYRGRIRADRDHTLCPQCFRRLRDAVRARALSRHRSK